MQLSPEELAVLDEHRPRVAHLWSEPKRCVAIFAVLDHGSTPALGEVLMGTDPDRAATLDHACRLARSFSIRAGLLELPSGGAAVVVVPDPKLDRQACLQVLHERLGAIPVRVLAGAGLHDAAEHLGTRLEPEALARLRGQVLEACLRPVLPRPDELTALVLSAGLRGRDHAAALHERGAEVWLWDDDPAAAQAAAEALGVRAWPGSWIDAEVDLLVPCGPEPVIDAALASSLAARVVCGGAPRVLASARARQALEARERWCVPELLGAAAEPIALAVAEGLVDQAHALALLERTAREVLASPQGAHERALALAVARSKAAQSRPRTA